MRLKSGQQSGAFPETFRQQNEYESLICSRIRTPAKIQFELRVDACFYQVTAASFEISACKSKQFSHTF